MAEPAWDWLVYILLQCVYCQQYLFCVLLYSSQAVGSAILSNMKIVIKELQKRQPLQTLPNPPTPHLSTITTPQFSNPPPLILNFTLLSTPLLLNLSLRLFAVPADSFASYQETPPYLPSINPGPLAYPMAAPSWVPP